MNIALKMGMTYSNTAPVRHPDTIRTLEIPNVSMADIAAHWRRMQAAAEAPAPTCDDCGAPLAEWEQDTCSECEHGQPGHSCRDDGCYGGGIS